jgi:hypothetical protein
MTGMILINHWMRKSQLFYILTSISSSFGPHRLVFRWLFIPFLQTELDAWADIVNNSRKRADRNKILPHGVPNDIYFNPERFGCLDFKVHYFSLFVILF